MSGEASRGGPLVVRVLDEERLGELAEHLRGLGCSLEQTGPATLTVRIPGTLRLDAAELELDLYLRVVEAGAGLRAERVD